MLGSGLGTRTQRVVPEQMLICGQRFIDWMALSGINLYLAMTGQEEVQYKVRALRHKHESVKREIR